MTVPPVVKRLVVACEPERAFDVFTRGFGRWWPLATHAVHPGAAVDVSFGDELGDLLFETTDDGETSEWGQVTAWEPPVRVAFSWHPGLEAHLATHVDVAFVRNDIGTDVTLKHSGWSARGDAATAVRDGYDIGWDAVLERFQDTLDDA